MESGYNVDTIYLDFSKAFDIYKWTSENNMKLNECKVEHLPYGKNDELRKQLFSLMTKKIETKECVKDLGIIMKHDCSFDEHKFLQKPKNFLLGS